MLSTRWRLSGRARAGYGNCLFLTCTQSGGSGRSQKTVFGMCFVSHRGFDTKWSFVEGLAKYELAGRRVFVEYCGLDKVEETWSRSTAALLQARLVVLVLSPRFQESAWCMEELRVAMLRPERVILVCYNTKAVPNEAALQQAHEELVQAPQLHSKGARRCAWLLAGVHICS